MDSPGRGSCVYMLNMQRDRSGRIVNKIFPKKSSLQWLLSSFFLSNLASFVRSFLPFLLSSLYFFAGRMVIFTEKSPFYFFSLLGLLNPSVANWAQHVFSLAGSVFFFSASALDASNPHPRPQPSLGLRFICPRYYSPAPMAPGASWPWLRPLLSGPPLSLPSAPSFPACRKRPGGA